MFLGEHALKMFDDLLLKLDVLGMSMEVYIDGENHVAGMCHSLCVWILNCSMQCSVLDRWVTNRF